ncbi:MAG: hypothetical protein FWE95_11330, partial [Planctomycetaceae bacterium]|nr:hypothetical protein [Planctomycetaceae bacterium]
PETAPDFVLKKQIHDSNKQRKKERDFNKFQQGDTEEVKLAGSAVGDLSPAPPTQTAPALPSAPEAPKKPRRATCSTGLLINTKSQREANRAARVAESVVSREYVDTAENGYKVDTYFHPHDPDFPITLRIPIILPKAGSFDGRIYAAELDRDFSLDRMLHMICIDQETDAVDTVITNRYDFFVNQINGLYNQLCTKKRGEGLLHDRAFYFRDDVIHRLAFAFAMAPKGLRTQADRGNFLEDCNNRTSEKYKIWTPILGKLRPIFFHNDWGWDSDVPDIDETWRIELKHHSHSPRLILFPAKMYRDTYQETKQHAPKKAVAIQQHAEQHRERQESAARALCDETGLKILTELHNRLGEKRYDLWCFNVVCQFDGKTVTFISENGFKNSGIRGHCTSEIESSIVAVLGKAFPFQTKTADAMVRQPKCNESSREMQEKHEVATREWQQKQLLTH